MSKFRDVLMFFVSFTLMFVLIIMQLSLFVNFKVLNGDFYKNALDKSDYFSLMRKDIDYGFKNLSMVTSIPENIFITSVSNEAIMKLAYRDINSAQDYMMKYNSKYAINKIDNMMIYGNLLKYAQKNNMQIDTNLKSQLLDASQEAGNIINNYSVLFNISAVDKYPQFQQFRKLIYMTYSIKILSIVATFLMVALLIFLNRKTPRRTFLWIGSSFIPAAIMTLVPSFLALYYKIPSRFAIDSAYLNLALKDITLGYISYFIVTGIIILTIGVCCMFVYNHLNNSSYKNKL